jgi:hypothetical protein
MLGRQSQALSRDRKLRSHTGGSVAGVPAVRVFRIKTSTADAAQFLNNSTNSSLHHGMIMIREHYLPTGVDRLEALEVLCNEIVCAHFLAS